MSDSANTSDFIEIEVIPDGTELEIKVPVDLYQRIQKLIFHGLPFKDIQHFTEIIAKVKAGDTKDPVAYHLHTLLWLTMQIEDAAKEKGVVVKKKFSTETGKIIE